MLIRAQSTCISNGAIYINCDRKCSSSSSLYEQAFAISEALEPTEMVNSTHGGWKAVSNFSDRAGEKEQGDDRNRGRQTTGNQQGNSRHHQRQPSSTPPAMYSFSLSTSFSRSTSHLIVLLRKVTYVPQQASQPTTISHNPTSRERLHQRRRIARLGRHSASLLP